MIGLIWTAVVGSFWGRVIGAAFLGLVALKGYGWTQQRAGANKARAQIEKVNRHAAEIGTRAAHRSITPGVRGNVDPTTRDD